MRGDKADHRNATITNSSAELSLHAFRSSRHAVLCEELFAKHKLILAAEIMPRRFWRKWQSRIYDGPTGRRDAELDERTKWVALLADFLNNSQTPMGLLLCENPSNMQLFEGAGLGSSLGLYSFSGLDAFSR